ncbi:MAG: hypothetical protein IH868_09420 [Chloroflexi bacterium]|nr:hypothetical protein [Chloroflexota bacterium]
MLIMKVAPIEFIGIIASIITAVIFAVVLGFQIRATNAARRAADAATAQAERLRPHVVIDDPQSLTLSTTGWKLVFGVHNVGFAPAYAVVIEVAAFNHQGEDVEVEHPAGNEQDIPPARGTIFILDSETNTAVRDLIMTRVGEPTFRVTARYAVLPDRPHSHQSEVTFRLVYEEGDGVHFAIHQGDRLDRALKQTV